MGVGSLVLLSAAVLDERQRLRAPRLQAATQVAQHITRADDLSRRIPYNGPPEDEVGQLIQAFNYTLSPTQEGSFVIPAMQVNAGGQVFSTQPLNLRVVKSTGAAGVNTNIAFVRLIIPRTNVFVGETFVFQVQLFFQELADQLPMPQVRAEGFTFLPTPQVPQTVPQPGVATQANRAGVNPDE